MIYTDTPPATPLESVSPQTKGAMGLGPTPNPLGIRRGPIGLVPMANIQLRGGLRRAPPQGPPYEGSLLGLVVLGKFASKFTSNLGSIC